MKKLINTSFAYAILAMIGGVFFREFTKFNDFTGQTSLSFFHLHLFALGMIFFLIVALCVKQFAIEKSKLLNWFYGLYNIGLLVTIGTFLLRGITQVKGIDLTSGLDAAIAGLGHMLLGIGIILFFITLKRANKEKTTKK